MGVTVNSDKISAPAYPPPFCLPTPPPTHTPRRSKETDREYKQDYTNINKCIDFTVTVTLCVVNLGGLS